MVDVIPLLGTAFGAAGVCLTLVLHQRRQRGTRRHQRQSLEQGGSACRRTPDSSNQACVVVTIQMIVQGPAR